MTEVEWHKFPDENPPDGLVLLTVQVKGEEQKIRIDEYTSKLRGFVIIQKRFVKAWAELPKPYRGK